jgi:hypothetical protein
MAFDVQSPYQPSHSASNISAQQSTPPSNRSDAPSRLSQSTITVIVENADTNPTGSINEDSRNGSVNTSSSSRSFQDTPIEASLNGIINAAVDQQVSAVQDLLSIRDRWLFPLFSSQETTCHPDKPTVQLYGQILKTYSQMMARKDQLPPIVHPRQLLTTAPLPLANCLSLARMWEDRASVAKQLVQETVRQEMRRLFDEVSLLSSCILTILDS